MVIVWLMMVNHLMINWLMVDPSGYVKHSYMEKNAHWVREFSNVDSI